MDFKTDNNGNISLKPMTGWELRHVANALLILGIEYVDNQEELERDERKMIPLVLRPDLALEFAEKLKTQANKLLEAQRKESTH